MPSVFCWRCCAVALGLIVGSMLSCAPGPSTSPDGTSADPPSVDSRPTLPEADREYLWDVEHHGNVLGAFGLKAWGAALRAGDAAGLEAACASGFEARVCAQPRELALERSGITVVRHERAGQADVSLDAAEFAAWLLERRGLFGDSPGVKCDVSTLSPVDREHLDGPWQALFRLRVFGETREGGPGEIVAYIRIESARPTRENLGQAGWLHAATVEQILVGRAPRPLFREATTERGLKSDGLHDNWTTPQTLVSTGGVFACDYNRDGCVDLLITDQSRPGLALYRGSPSGQFEDVTLQSGLLTRNGRLDPFLVAPNDEACFVDLDNDGWEDLILVHSHQVYRNMEGRGFQPVTRRTNLFDLIEAAPGPWRRVSGVVTADYDRDGRLDLYVFRADSGPDADADWLDRKRVRTTTNQLLRNVGNWRFEDVTQRTGTRGGGRSTFTAAWLHANDDDRPDLYVIDEFGKGVLLVNAADGKFTEHLLIREPADFGSMGLAVGDVNNDGRVDIYSANMYSKAGNRLLGNIPPGRYSDEIMAGFRRLVAGSQLYVNRGDLRFAPVGNEFQVRDVGWTWGQALADFNNDGWLDLYSTAGFISRDRDKPDG